MTTPHITEAQFQDWLIKFARYNGWRVAHFRPAKTDRGWRTAVQGDGAGFPDCVLVRRSRLIFAELKSDTGRVSAEQQAWLDALSGRCGVEVYVWRPRNVVLVEDILTREMP